MANARQPKKTHDSSRAAPFANSRNPVVRRKAPNTHSWGKTTAALSSTLFADFTRANLFAAAAVSISRTADFTRIGGKPADLAHSLKYRGADRIICSS